MPAGTRAVAVDSSGRLVRELEHRGIDARRASSTRRLEWEWCQCDKMHIIQGLAKGDSKIILRPFVGKDSSEDPGLFNFWE